MFMLFYVITKANNKRMQTLREHLGIKRLFILHDISYVLITNTQYLTVHNIIKCLATRWFKEGCYSCRKNAIAGLEVQSKGNC